MGGFVACRSENFMVDDGWMWWLVIMEVGDR